MLANFPDDPTGFKVRDAYCGLELLATNPVNGAQVTLFVVDAFDDAWVL